MAQTDVITSNSSKFLASAFNWMGAGLLATGVIAWVMAASGMAVALASSPLFFVLLIGELGLVFYLSGRINKISASTAQGLFMAYAAANGLTLSTIFSAYAKTDIASAFIISSVMFIAAAVYGMVTKRDLSGWSSLLFMALIGLIIAILVNMILGSSIIHWAVSVIGVIVFVALTAYDVQDIKNMGEQYDNDPRYAVLGALSLYLDLINLFLFVLQFFGGSDD